MRLSIFFLVTRLPLLLSVNCTTYGVEAEDHVLTTDSRAEGIERFAVRDMPTHEGMFISGGSDRFQGEMRVTGWFAPGQEHDIFDYIGLAFEREGDQLAPHTLFHSPEVEHITVRQVFFDVPRDLDVVAFGSDGGLVIDDIGGTVSVHEAADPVAVSNTDGEVDIESAGQVYVDNTGRVEIDTRGQVSGGIAHGGWIEAGWDDGEAGMGDIDIAVTGNDFERLSLTTDRGEIEVDLPAGGFTLDIEAGYSRGEGEHERKGHVTIDVGDVYVDQDGYVSGIYEVDGGGPVIVVRDAHILEIR